MHKYFYINIRNPFKEINKLKGIFKPLKCYFEITFSNYNPVFWCPKPAWIQIVSSPVMWKDKFDTPRYEYEPYIWIHIFKLNLVWRWDNKDIKYISEYWEQALWYLYYTNTISQGLIDKPDIEKAKESWPWQDSNGNSSWEDDYLIK